MPKWLTFAFALFLSLQVFSTRGQRYFDFFYTNIPKAKFDEYSASYSYALGWLQTGQYVSPPNCSNCTDYSRDSKLKKQALDSLILLYKEGRFKDIYSKLYVSNNNYFATDKTADLPYIVKTLYKIEVKTPIPVLQIKMTFYDMPGKKPGIASIEILGSNTMKMYDSKIVIDSYKQKVRDDLDEPAPISN